MRTPAERADRTPTPHGDGPRDPTPDEARSDALRGIAAAVVRARAQTDRMGRLRPEAGGDLLAECERHLSALIVVGAVPGPADPDRRPLT